MLQTKKPPTRRQLDRDRTRASVIRHATDLFNERSYEDVGIRDIAARMRMSTGAVFNHFVSKADIFKACFGVNPPMAADWVEAVRLLEWAKGQVETLDLGAESIGHYGALVALLDKAHAQ